MRTRGSVDNRNNYQARSLNKTKRQRELLRLTHENQVRQPQFEFKKGIVLFKIYNENKDYCGHNHFFHS